MKEALNRIFYLLTGIRAENIKENFTPGSGDLDGYNVVLGFDSINEDFSKIPFSKYPLVIVEIPEDSSYRKEQTIEGYPNGIFTPVYRFEFHVIIYVGGKGRGYTLLGKDSTLGILDAYDNLESALFGTEARMRLDNGSGAYVDQVYYPLNIEEGKGLDEYGRVYLRARKFIAEYRNLVIDY